MTWDELCLTSHPKRRMVSAMRGEHVWSAFCTLTGRCSPVLEPAAGYGNCPGCGAPFIPDTPLSTDGVCEPCAMEQ